MKARKYLEIKNHQKIAEDLDDKVEHRHPKLLSKVVSSNSIKIPAANKPVVVGKVEPKERPKQQPSFTLSKAIIAGDLYKESEPNVYRRTRNICSSADDELNAIALKASGQDTLIRKSDQLKRKLCDKGIIKESSPIQIPKKLDEYILIGGSLWKKTPKEEPFAPEVDDFFRIEDDELDYQFRLAEATKDPTLRSKRFAKVRNMVLSNAKQASDKRHAEKFKPKQYI